MCFKGTVIESVDQKMSAQFLPHKKFSVSGVITSPPDRKDYTFLPGQTVNLTWVFNDALPAVVYRGWSLSSTAGPGGHLSEIYRENNPDIRTKLYDVDVVKPATLVLRNVNQSYDGIYTFSLQVDGPGFFTRSVRVFIASKFCMSMRITFI